jgi:hypothetical protein
MVNNSDWHLRCWGLSDENEKVIEFYKLNENGWRFDYGSDEKLRVFLKHFGRTNAEDEDQLIKELSQNDDRFPLLYMKINDGELRHLLNNYSIARLGDLAIIDRKKISDNWQDFRKNISEPSERRHEKQSSDEDFRNKWGFKKFW